MEASWGFRGCRWEMLSLQPVLTPLLGLFPAWPDAWTVSALDGEGQRLHSELPPGGLSSSPSLRSCCKRSPILISIIYIWVFFCSLASWEKFEFGPILIMWLRFWTPPNCTYRLVNEPLAAWWHPVCTGTGPIVQLESLLDPYLQLKSVSYIIKSSDLSTTSSVNIFCMCVVWRRACSRTKAEREALDE